MNWLANLAHKRTPWVLLALTAFTFEVIALFFQYQMGLEPCIMCIYQRTAMLGLLIAGIIGAINPSNILIRITAFTSWAGASIWGFLLAREHIDMQTTTDPFAFSCEFEPNFPVPLHEWVPQFFAATGDCGNIDWQFLSLSMPAWMEIIFGLISLVLIVVVFSRLMIKKSV
ncbi:disulfide bond formation protein B [Pseudoalteromonas sp. A601]|uniref:disulfide bond formation protein DsbB n=1 Tax=Pseudoalteromonas sp. A601 TaxID=1967839 RepID=UPI000B3D4B0A|nr:disulfide bond formation protein DsbB [Pseudoalteromonas sp. A601]OUS74616.1 disulfide bond formation protein B [Pseudoalteromonas sp. A601]